MSLTIELKDSAEQTAFNLKRWAQMLADPDLARLPHRIETDRHGHIIMSPPPAPVHGDRESEIVFQLKSLLPEGRTITNCPVSTSDGVKAPDVAWVVPERRQEVRSLMCLIRAPEICVEVLSPSNTLQEIQEKTALYFEAGACEVWICEEDGKIRFHFRMPPNIRQSSELCPEFPPAINVA
ncbi:MAG: Uma2 family endonuclease [Verrucomicrobia bacterium]|nr:Uma2 family endonuclease [Verrucomicrobiota bacterium]